MQFTVARALPRRLIITNYKEDGAKEVIRGYKGTHSHFKLPPRHHGEGFDPERRRLREEAAQAKLDLMRENGSDWAGDDFYGKRNDLALFWLFGMILVPALGLAIAAATYGTLWGAVPGVRMGLGL